VLISKIESSPRRVPWSPRYDTPDEKPSRTRRETVTRFAYLKTHGHYTEIILLAESSPDFPLSGESDLGWGARGAEPGPATIRNMNFLWF
jgi:hypothetical protein